MGTPALLRVSRARGGVRSRSRRGDHPGDVSRHDGRRRRGRRRHRVHRPGLAPRRDVRLGCCRCPQRRRPPPPAPLAAAAVAPAASPVPLPPPPPVPGSPAAARSPPHPARRSRVPEHGEGGHAGVRGPAPQLRLRSSGVDTLGLLGPLSPGPEGLLKARKAEIGSNEGLVSVRKAEPVARAPGGDRPPRRAHLPLRRQGRHPRVRGPPRELHLRDEGRRHGHAPRGARAGRGRLPDPPARIAHGERASRSVSSEPILVTAAVTRGLERAVQCSDAAVAQRPTPRSASSSTSTGTGVSGSSRRDYYPATTEEARRVLDSIQRHGNRDGFRRAARDPPMALTLFQRDVCRLLADTRLRQRRELCRRRGCA